MAAPLCFVLMPFGQKPDATGMIVDFDAVYGELIRPAIEEAGLEPLRADEEQTGGIIHKPMFERLILCEFAVADLSTANPNVFYELGLRHAVRPWSTVVVFAEGGRLPFDVAPIRGLPYHLAGDGRPDRVAETRALLVERLKEARKASTDSPIFQLVEGFRAPEVDRVKTDVFRDRVRYSAEAKAKLAEARHDGLEAVRAVERDLGPLEDVEAGVVIDLLLSYRAVGDGWSDMVKLVERMPPPLRATVLVQEQFALALNRDGQGERAERVLIELLERRGASSETLGILGRVYKDRWEAARSAGDDLRAPVLLKKAADAYRRGFEADWRDAYPGINAVTLMEIMEPPDPRAQSLIPVVGYAVQRRAAGDPDYWDHATLLELAVLAGDREGAQESLAEAAAAVREPWEPETTARNVRLIREARDRRGADVRWLRAIEEQLGRLAREASA